MNQNLNLKKPKPLIYGILAFFLLATNFSAFAQVTLANQQAVDNFPNTTTTINGSLNIGGAFAASDISDLSNLKNITKITGDLAISYNNLLKDLNGLQNIQFVGGSIFITNNAQLSDCLLIVDLLASQARIGGQIIIDNNATGCDSQEDIIKTNNICGNPGNNRDSDRDGVIDCVDECPFDKNKIKEGDCGCGYEEGDFDKDGVSDCKDGCPYDKNKIAAGNCGCGNKETPDSDGDGVYDCKDECPYNPYVYIKGKCGCEAPVITHVRMRSSGNCMDQNTFDPSDDTYQATIRVYFDYPPKLGAIRFRGATSHRFDFKNENTSQTAFDFDLTFKADGNKVDFTVEYIGNEYCAYRFRGATARSPCSDQVCDMPTNGTSIVQGNQVQLSWDYVADWMSYEYRYRMQGTTDWIHQWTDQTAVIICNLATNQTYEYEVRAYCGTDRKSSFASGTFNTQNESIACKPVSSLNDCQIQTVEVLKMRRCHDRGTWYGSDDFFYADVLVTFQNPPSKGQLKIEGNTTAEIEVEALQNSNYHQFTGLKLYENNSKIDLSASFSKDSDCAYTINYPIPANPCWQGRMANGFSENPLDLINDINSLSQKNNYLTAYPNPVDSRLRIDFQMPLLSPDPDSRLSIYNIFGQVQYSLPLNSRDNRMQLDLSNLETGMYYLVLTNGKFRTSQKIIKR